MRRLALGVRCVHPVSAHAWRALAAVAGLGLAVAAWPATAAAAPGDVNCDGVANAADIDALTAAVFEGSSCPTSDVNQDGGRTAPDFIALFRILSAAIPTATGTATVTP